MKKSIFLSFILCLCLIACIPQQVMAQKQSRMEKLLRYLNDNDADKWQWRYWFADRQPDYFW